MKYTVYWISDAEQDLAAIWLAASDRKGVTQAAHRIDQLLRSRPLDAGESRQSTVQRIVFDHPLGIQYEVIEDDKKVRMIAVAPLT